MSLIKKLYTLTLAACCLVFATGSLADQVHNELPVDRVHGALSVMVLGSGGPQVTTSGRASAGYLIFVDGQPKILMDCGGGTFLRLGQSGANIKDLDTVLISHLHIDHVGDLAAILKSMYFQNRAANISTTPINYPDGRTAPVNIYGPGANPATFQAALDAGIIANPWPDLIDPSTTQYPSTSEYINQEFNINNGTYRYLHIFTQMISAGVFGYTVKDVSPNWKVYNPSVLLNKNGLTITAVAVHHGPAPALAFRIDYKGKSIVYSGDTNSAGDNMISLSKGADLLIYDTSITDTLPNSAPNDKMFFTLHTTPTRMGTVAAAAGAKELVLSHITPITAPRLPEVKSLIQASGFNGEISVAHDLKVYNLDDVDNM